MGFDACVMAVKYAKKFGSTCIVDPFCGKGSVLAIANHFGMNSIGGLFVSFPFFFVCCMYLFVVQWNFHRKDVGMQSIYEWMVIQ